MATPDAVAVSNRQSLLPLVCARSTRPAADLAALSWLPDQGGVFGETGTLEGVRVLRPGDLFRADPDGRVHTRRLADPFWAGQEDPPDWDAVLA
jgi:hypothetical protein